MFYKFSEEGGNRKREIDSKAVSLAGIWVDLLTGLANLLGFNRKTTKKRALTPIRRWHIWLTTEI